MAIPAAQTETEMPQELAVGAGEGQVFEAFVGGSVRRAFEQRVQRYQRVQQRWCGMSPLIRDEGRTR